MEKKSVRNSNVELLRILAALGVIVLHYNNAEIGGGFRYVEVFSANSYIMYFLENMFICAVNLFVLITGFFMSEKKKVSIRKPIELVCQVIVFNMGILLLRTIIGGSILPWKEYLIGILPLNYYVTLYIVVYLLSPYINMLLGSLTDGSFKSLVTMLFILFSLWPTILETVSMIAGGDLGGMNTIGITGSQSGYTSLNFILMYILGVYLKRTITRENPTKYLWKLCLCWIIQFAISYIAMVKGFGMGPIWAYSNPLVILSAIYSFMLFYNMKEIKSKAINELAKASFTVYLMHSFFLSKIKIDVFVGMNPIIYVGHVIISCMVIYLICYILYLIYNLIASHVFKYLNKKIYFLDVTCEKL